MRLDYRDHFVTAVALLTGKVQAFAYSNQHDALLRCSDHSCTATSSEIQ
jgi:hypothetical protein